MNFVGLWRWWLAVVCLVASLLCLAVYLYGVHVTAGLRDNYAQEGEVRCPMESPIKLTVANYTFQRVSNVDVRLEAWRGKVSDNLLGATRFTFNRVLAPFESASACYSDQSVSVSPDLTRTPDANGVVRTSLSDSMPQIRAYDKKVRGVEIVLLEVAVTHK